jgi:hypothetical protein
MDHDKIVNKRVQRIARDHDCTVDDVHAALNRHPIELDRDRFLKRTLAMELVELDELQQAFRGKALVDRDVAAGALMVKIAERRATLLGLNPPIGHAVQVIQHEPLEKKTSTERIMAAINRICLSAQDGRARGLRAVDGTLEYSSSRLPVAQLTSFTPIYRCNGISLIFVAYICCEMRAGGLIFWA